METRKLTEIRVQVLDFELKIKNRIQTMANHIAMKLLSYLPQIELPETEILLISLAGNSYSSSPFYELGVDLRNGIGQMGLDIPINDFLKKNDHHKVELLASLILNGLLQFFQYFNLKIDCNQILQKEIITKDFFSPVTAPNLSPMGSYSCWAEILRNYNYSSYRLVFKRYDKLEYFHLMDKEHFFGNEHPEISISEMMKYVHTIKTIGWATNSVFSLSYGKEIYLFNAEDKTIIKTNN